MKLKRYDSVIRFTIYHPINKGASLEIESAIFTKLKNAMNNVEKNEENIF